MSSSTPTSSVRPQRKGTVVRVRTIIALVLAVIAAVFIAQNRQHVSISLLVVDVVAPLWLLLTAAAAVGLVIGLLLRRSR